MKKVVCAWIGAFPDEEEFYDDYLSVDYGSDFDDDFDDDDQDPNSRFGNDAGLEYYDDAYMESWWFDELTIGNISIDRGDLQDEEYFFDDLIDTLKTRNLSGKNTITFLFGERGDNPANEDLFDYEGMTSGGAPIEFVFKKEYTVN